MWDVALNHPVACQSYDAEILVLFHFAECCFLQGSSRNVAGTAMSPVTDPLSDLERPTKELRDGRMISRLYSASHWQIALVVVLTMQGSQQSVVRDTARAMEPLKVVMPGRRNSQESTHTQDCKAQAMLRGKRAHRC